MNKSVAEEAADIYNRAAKYIRKYGWRVSGMSEHGKPRCSMGALESASPTRIWDKNLSRFMYKQLYAELKGLNLTQFNLKHKNGEKVAQLFDATADKIRQSYPAT